MNTDISPVILTLSAAKGKNLKTADSGTAAPRVPNDADADRRRWLVD